MGRNPAISSLEALLQQQQIMDCEGSMPGPVLVCEGSSLREAFPTWDRNPFGEGDKGAFPDDWFASKGLTHQEGFYTGNDAMSRRRKNVDLPYD